MYKEVGDFDQARFPSSLAPSQGRAELPVGAEEVKGAYSTTLAEFSALPPEVQAVIQDEVRAVAKVSGAGSDEAKRRMVQLVRMVHNAIAGRGEIEQDAPDKLVPMVELARKLRGVKTRSQ